MNGKPIALTADQLAAAAAALQMQGRTAEAESLYRGVLSSNPEHFDSLHAVGLLSLQRGAPQDALAPLEKALSLRQDSAEAHSDLGMALASLDRHAEAVLHFEKALALKPDFATAHNNLGNVLAALHRGKDAIAHFERAIAIRPGYTLAEFNLANALAKGEWHAAAASHYHKALEQNPDWVEALCGRSDGALKPYERAIAIDPANAAAHHGAGLVMQVLGQLEKARVAFGKAVELAPETLSYHRFLAETKRFNADDSQIAAMERLASGLASLDQEQQLELHFALGKAYGDIGHHDVAFRHLVAGNAIKHKLERFDEAAHLDMMRHIQTVFTADLLRRNVGSGDPSNVPVFILGMPRSDSTLIEQILASHPGIFGAGELRNR